MPGPFSQAAGQLAGASNKLGSAAGLVERVRGLISDARDQVAATFGPTDGGAELLAALSTLHNTVDELTTQLVYTSGAVRAAAARATGRTE